MKINTDNYPKIITYISITAIALLLLVTYLSESDSVCRGADCARVTFFGSPYQYFSLPILGVLATSIPLTFLKPQVFKTWAKFAVVALPLMALWIMSGQETTGFLDILKDRESISIASAVLFVFISYGIFIVQSFQLRNK